MRMRTLLPWSVAAVVALVGCSQGDATDVPTSEIAPRIRVVSHATQTEVTVILYRGTAGLHRLQLTAGDALRVLPPTGPAVTMAVQGADTLQVRYVATLPPVEPGDELVVALLRATLADAPNTIVTVPDAPVVNGPEAGATFEPDAEFEVAWVPFADDTVEVRFAQTACEDLSPDEAAAVEAFVGLPGTLHDGTAGSASVTFFPGGSALACEADLLVGRVRGDVDLDPALAGLRSDTRIVREAPARRLVFAPGD